MVRLDTLFFTSFIVSVRVCIYIYIIYILLYQYIKYIQYMYYISYIILLYHLLSIVPHYVSHVHLFSDTPPRYLAGQWEAKEILGIRCLAPLQSTDETQIFVLPASALVEGIYPLVNIQKAIENGHRNNGFTH